MMYVERTLPDNGYKKRHVARVEVYKLLLITFVFLLLVFWGGGCASDTKVVYSPAGPAVI